MQLFKWAVLASWVEYRTVNEYTGSCISIGIYYSISYSLC